MLPPHLLLTHTRARPPSSKSQQVSDERFSPSPSPLLPAVSHPSSSPVHDLSSLPLTSTKSSVPKRIEIGEDLIVDLPSGITGLEAHPAPSSASSHPIPLLQPISSHLASLRLSSALACTPALRTVSLGAVGAPAHASSVSPVLSCAQGTGLSSVSALSSAPVSPGVSGAPARLPPSPSVAPASSALSAPPLSPGISDADALRTVSPASGLSSELPCAQVTGSGVSPCMTGAS